MNTSRTMKSIQVVLFAIVLITGQASAILMEADLFSTGDGLLTQDTETGLEWLDIPVTLNLSYTEIIAGHGNLVTLHRFRYATRAEVHTLFENANIPYITDKWSFENGAPVHSLQNLIGKIDYMHSAGLIHQTIGFTGDIDGETHYAAKLEYWVSAGSGLAASSWRTYAPDYNHESYGSYLVRVIPEPSSIAMIGVFTGGIYFARRVFII